MMDRRLGEPKKVDAGKKIVCGAPGNRAAQMSLTLTLSRRFTLTRSCGAASPATKREKRIKSGSGRDILIWARESERPIHPLARPIDSTTLVG